MQFKVPQNIDLEDKIVGPLTLLQFLYILGGGVIDYALFMAIGSNFIFYIIAIPIGILALALAFLKIQDQPLLHFITAALFFYSRPKERHWQRVGTSTMMVKNLPQTEIKAPATVKRNASQSELDQLAYMLDTHRGKAADNSK